MLTIALVNSKAGTGKTTSAVWLATALHGAGCPVLLVDADPQGSALEWSDLAGGFPFRLMGMPRKDLHQRAPMYAQPDELVIIDAPQLEDHGPIARSAMRLADEVVIPCAPTVLEISRTAPMRAELDAEAAARPTPLRSCVLLNRTVAHANSVSATRTAFKGMGYDVLRPVVPRLEIYAQSYGAALPAAGISLWRYVATDLLNRAVTAERTR